MSSELSEARRALALAMKGPSMTPGIDRAEAIERFVRALIANPEPVDPVLEWAAQFSACPPGCTEPPGHLGPHRVRLDADSGPQPSAPERPAEKCLHERYVGLTMSGPDRCIDCGAMRYGDDPFTMPAPAPRESDPACPECSMPDGHKLQCSRRPERQAVLPANPSSGGVADPPRRLFWCQSCGCWVGASNGENCNLCGRAVDAPAVASLPNPPSPITGNDGTGGQQAGREPSDVLPVDVSIAHVAWLDAGGDGPDPAVLWLDGYDAGRASLEKRIGAYERFVEYVKSSRLADVFDARAIRGRIEELESELSATGTKEAK